MHVPGSLGIIPPTRLTGMESLPKGILLDFWQWPGSDLLSNTFRGAYAEYLVALAVGSADGVREEWAPYDVHAPYDARIEVKTSAYIQTWVQAGYSTPRFDIRPTRNWDPMTNEFSDSVSRSSDVYVFCLHHHRHQATIDPLDAAQWTFYVIPTSDLDRMLGHQKTIGLKTLRELGAQEVPFENLDGAIYSAFSGR